VNGNISSTSGKSSAHDHDANDAAWPTLGFLESEAADSEDVELFGGFYYLDGNGKLQRDGGHAVVVSGVWSVDGKPHIAFKDDAKQKVPGGTRQTESPIDTPGGLIHIPGLDGQGTPGGGPAVVEYYIVERIVCESYEAS